MKKAAIIVGSLIFIFIIGMSASSDFNYLVKSNLKRITKDPAQLCIDYESKNFISPNSVRIYQATKVDDSKMLVRVLSKNGFGTEVQSIVRCYLVDGKFNEFSHSVKKLTTTE